MLKLISVFWGVVFFVSAANSMPKSVNCKTVIGGWIETIYQIELNFSEKELGPLFYHQTQSRY